MKKVILDPVNIERYAEFGRENPVASVVISILLIFTLILVFSIIGSDKR